jgi:ABC-type polysaccharide/polyol phosphate export permease
MEVSTKPSEKIYQSSVQTIIQPTRGFIPINLHDLWQYRELIYFLVWRDIKIRYKQSVLGVTWVILQPVISTVILQSCSESCFEHPVMKSLTQYLLCLGYFPGHTLPIL